MKERPILFSGPMVRAILEGRKTQTRRVMKPQPSWVADGVMYWKGTAGMIHSHRCPCGVPGDRLWVRESFQPLLREEIGATPASSEYDYKTGQGYEVSYPATDGVQEYYDLSTDEAFCSRVTPSIYMPRWASRITLEITDVRVQRIQDISEEDCEAEGVSLVPTDCQGECGQTPCGITRSRFIGLWDSINAKRGYGWDKNPWVWVLTFRRVGA